MSSVPFRRIPPTRTFLARRRSTSVKRVSNLVFGSSMATLTVAVHALVAVAQAPRLRPSDGATSALVNVRVAMSGNLGTFWKTALTLASHGSGYEPLSLTCVWLPHGVVTLQYCQLGLVEPAWG